MINPLVQRGEFLVALGENATTLCPAHAQDFAITAMLLDLSPSLYEIDPEEPYVACQTCFMIHTQGQGEKGTH